MDIQLLPAPFIEKILLSPLNCLGTPSKNQLTIKLINGRLFLECQFYLIDLYFYHYVLLIIKVLKSGTVSPLTFFFFPRLVWLFWVPYSPMPIFGSVCQILQKELLKLWECFVLFNHYTNGCLGCFLWIGVFHHIIINMTDRQTLTCSVIILRINFCF